MSQIALAVAVVSGLAAAQPAAPEARTILEQAASAMESVRTASYDARVQVRSGDVQRVVTGHVTLEKFPSSTGLVLTGKIAVSGKIIRAASSEIETFQVVYDGDMVRRYLAGSEVILQADPGYGGESLLQGSFGAPVLRHFLAVAPFMAELSAPEITYVGTEEIEGRPAHVIEVRFDDKGTLVRWFIDTEDHLPRQRLRQFRSARGTEVFSALNLSNLAVNAEIEPDAFELTAPEGSRVELMGQRPPEPVEVGDLAPDWTLTDGEGGEHSLADYRGKLVVLDFWASWCPHCKRAMPAMQKLHDTYASRGVAIFGVNCRERRRIDPAAFVRDAGFTYPVLVDGGRIAPQYRVRGIPAFFIIGPDGRVLHRSSGFSQQAEDALVTVIEQYVADEGT